MLLEDMNLVGKSDDEKDEHIWACHHEIRQLRKNCFTVHEVESLCLSMISEVISRKRDVPRHDPA